MQSCCALQLLHNNLLPPGRGDLGHARRCIAAPLTASPSLQPVHLYVSRTQGVISQLPAYARAGTLCTRCGSGGKCGRQHAAVKPPVSSQLALQLLCFGSLTPPLQTSWRTRCIGWAAASCSLTPVIFSSRPTAARTPPRCQTAQCCPYAPTEPHPRPPRAATRLPLCAFGCPAARHPRQHHRRMG